MLSNWVPKYISLGTMGLTSQDSDAAGLPIGIGGNYPATTEEEEIANFNDYLSIIYKCYITRLKCKYISVVCPNADRSCQQIQLSDINAKQMQIFAESVKLYAPKGTSEVRVCFLKK